MSEKIKFKGYRKLRCWGDKNNAKIKNDLFGIINKHNILYLDTLGDSKKICLYHFFCDKVSKPEKEREIETLEAWEGLQKIGYRLVRVTEVEIME